MPIYDGNGSAYIYTGVLLNGTDKATPVTGGYDGSKYTYDSYMINATNTTAGIAIHSGSGTWHKSGTVSKIDVTNFTTLTFTINAPRGFYVLNVYFGLYPNQTSVYNSATKAVSETNYTNLYETSRTYTLDVSSLTGSYYLGLYCFSGENYPINITKIALTPAVNISYNVSNHKIKSVYDYDGNSYHKIRYGYDYNGSAYKLVYSSSYQLVPSAASNFSTHTASSSSATVNSDGSLGLSAYSAGSNENTYAYGMIRTASPIDFSKYSKLTIVGTGTKHDGYDTRGHIRVAGKSAAQNYISGYAASSSGTVCTESWDWGSQSLMTTGGTNSFTQTYDISSVTGTYYLYFWCSGYAWMGTSMTITSCIFE